MLDTLVCVYVDKAHQHYLASFYRSAPGRHLLRLPSARVWEVYADPTIPASFHDDKRIVLRTAETYEALPLKTFEMIRYCVETFEFQRLLKIDVTIMQTRFNGPAFAGRSPVDLERLEKFLMELTAPGDYGGFRHRPGVSREDAIGWAAKKGCRIDVDRLFVSGALPPFFDGKCYFVSNAFARFISQRGAPTAREHASYMPAEDVMIGRLFEQFRRSDNHVESTSKQDSPRAPLASRSGQHLGKVAHRVHVALGIKNLQRKAMGRASEGRPSYPLFDAQWYLAQNPDVRAAGIDPLEHYMRYGAAEGRDPHPLFDARWYLAQNPDVRAAGVNPLDHFTRYGAAEGRNPHPLFDAQWYLAQNPDVRAAGINPLEHYMRYGATEGRDPHPLFDGQWYLACYPDVRLTGLNPLAHYARYGGVEKRTPHPLFWPKWYLHTYADAESRDLNALEHYIYYGAPSGHYANPLFSFAQYKSDPNGGGFTFLYRVVSRQDIANFVGSAFGQAKITEEWGALLRAYVEGDREGVIRLVDVVLSHSAPANTLYSPARSTLFQLKAECLLADNRATDALDAAKACVRLEPENKERLEVLRTCLLHRPLLSRPRTGLIVLLITCEKYRDRARSTYRTLIDLGLHVKVVVGATATIDFDCDLLRVDAGDNYEDLPMKVRDSLNWVYENYGASVGVVKIDDDVAINDRAALSQFLFSLPLGGSQYIGQAGGVRPIWRDFHYGKCSEPSLNSTPYGKRVATRYAVGLLYYLSGSAVEKFYEFVHRYPGEIGGELYEDLFVGKIMDASSVAPQDVKFFEMGLALESLIW